MKVIFSRKGFDSQYGCIASPILPDGKMVSFPIPSMYGRPLSDIQTPVGSMHTLISSLSADRIPGDTSVHLDPDLWKPNVNRMEGWRQSFGQVGSAQRHLENKGVSEGDLFLFFGWFRMVENSHDKWRYKTGAPDIHSLFGWLQVGEIIRMDAAPEIPAWLSDHPHVAFSNHLGKFNTIYVASEKLDIDGTSVEADGAGVFSRWSDGLQLTAPGKSRSIWRLPKWMAPSADRSCLSYHDNPDRWTVENDQVILRSVAKGQEFVQEVDCLEGRRWLGALIASHIRS